IGYAGDLSELGRVVNLVLLQGESADLVKVSQELDELKADRKKSREELERLLPQHPIVKELKDVGGKINEATDELLRRLRPASGKANPQDAGRFWSDVGRPVLTKQRKNLENLSEELDKASSVTTQEINDRVRSTTNVLVGISVGLILIVIGFALRTI